MKKTIITISDFCQYKGEPEKAVPIIDEVVLERFITQAGFRRVCDDDNQDNPTVVRVIDNRIRKSSTSDIYDYLVELLEKEHYAWLLPLKKYRVLLFKPTVLQMKRIIPKVLRDTAINSYIPFDNGIVVITKDGVSIKPYSEVLTEKTCILEEKIIRKSVDISDSDYKKGAWFKMCENAVGKEGLPYLMRSIGFMLSTFKDKANSKMVVFSDAAISDSDEANGGSCKSLLAYDSLCEIRNVHYVDAKRFKADDKFGFQGVKSTHDIICLDDIQKGFKQSVIYNKITGSFSSEDKYVSLKTSEFRDSPKVIVTGNYGLVMNGGSDRRRSCVIGFTDYYSDKRRPIDEFGHRFFDEWTGKRAIEYQLFYAFQFECIRMYLEQGMESYKSEQVAQKSVASNYPKGLIGAINEAKYKLIGAENAMLQKGWLSTIGRSEPNTLEVLRKIMDSEGYVIDTSIRRKVNKTDANASQLYFWRKK